MKKSKLDNWICNTEALPTLTREALERLQLDGINAVLQKQAEKYGKIPEKLKSLEQLRELPFTTAEELSLHPGRFLLTSQAEVARIISGTTSGTTGPGKRVFYTEQDCAHTVGFFAAGISEMLNPGEKCLIAFPFTGPFGLGDLIAQAVEQLGAIPVRAGYGWTYKELCQLIREEQPQTYIGFPVPLLSAKRLYEAHFPIERALLSADACPEGVLQALEMPCFPHYGSRECGLGGAVTCPAHEGMHLRENHILAEIIDEKGNVLPDGEYGELVITTFGLEAMPLLRYRTGDFTRILPPCPCGSVTKRLDTVSRSPMEQLDSALFPIPELIDYRAELGEALTVTARTLQPGLEPEIANRAAEIFPDIPVAVQSEPARLAHRPMYPGKRFLQKL